MFMARLSGMEIGRRAEVVREGIIIDSDTGNPTVSSQHHSQELQISILQDEGPRRLLSMYEKYRYTRIKPHFNTSVY
jgi:Uma2 family endonuclease